MTLFSSLFWMWVEQLVGAVMPAIFVNSIKQSFLGGTVPSVYQSIINTNTNIGTANVSLNVPSPGLFSFGMVRVHSIVPPTGANFRVAGMWVSDGNASNSRQIYAGDSATSQTSVPFDYTYEFITDLPNANTVIVSVNTNNANSFCDFEMAGT